MIRIRVRILCLTSLCVCAGDTGLRGMIRKGAALHLALETGRGGYNSP